MKTSWLAAFTCIALVLSGCAANQSQQSQTEQAASGNTTSTRDMRNAAQDASSAARDVRRAISDLKSIFQ